jgi:hypothetical protein
MKKTLLTLAVFAFATICIIAGCLLIVTAIAYAQIIDNVVGAADMYEVSNAVPAADAFEMPAPPAPTITGNTFTFSLGTDNNLYASETVHFSDGSTRAGAVINIDDVLHFLVRMRNMMANHVTSQVRAAQEVYE